MLNSLATKFTDDLYRHCHLNEARRPVYIYGFKLFLSTMSSVASILIVSAFLPHCFSGAMFLVVFISLRLFAGGYHAPTYGRCFVLSNCVYFISVGLTCSISVCTTSKTICILCVTLTLIAGITIFMLAPIRNKNHPLSETRYKRNRCVARILACIWVAISVAVSFSFIGYYAILMSVTLTAVAVMMIVPKIGERRI